MKVLSINIFVICMIGIKICFSAIISDTVEVKESPQGKIICKLNKDVFVREISKEEDFYKIEIEAYVTASDFNKLPFIDIPLYNKFNKVIGNTIQYKPEEWESVNIKEGKGRLFIEGYINKNNVIENTTHDYKLNKLINENNKINLEKFYEIFKDWQTYGPIQNYKASINKSIKNMDMIIIFNADMLQWQSKSIFCFINNQLLIVGTKSNNYDRKNFIKKHNNYYYIIGENKLSKIDIDKYLKEINSQFEYQQ